jgi:2-polyprenyl-3-methyl-5-hydroxy-6-metoxy-1,4-benzoquinol methylase
MDGKQRLVELNVEQKAFYEARAVTGGVRNPVANLPTRLWTRLRQAMQRAEKHSGVGAAILDTHRAWLGDLSDKDVLDLGCYSGNRLSLEIARSARSYLGLDLSAKAIETLSAKLVEIPGAEARSGDFLAEDFRERFDVIYAYGVLHHFEDVEVLSRELHEALRPGGIVVAIDPLQSDPLNRLARRLYRPWQSDKDWEWPFDRRTFAVLGRHFTLEAVQGFRGVSKLGFVAGPWGGPVARWGNRMDLRHANRFGPALALCWVVCTKLRKPKAPTPAG